MVALGGDHPMEVVGHSSPDFRSCLAKRKTCGSGLAREEALSVNINVE